MGCWNDGMVNRKIGVMESWSNGRSHQITVITLLVTVIDVRRTVEWWVNEGTRDVRSHRSLGRGTRRNDT